MIKAFIGAVVLFASATESIKQAELWFDIPQGLLEAICFTESTHNPVALTPKDGGPHTSVGLCQVQVRTARELGFRGTEEDLMHPGVNSMYAAKYLSKQASRYKSWIHAISAYNVGSLKRKNGKYINQEYVDKVLTRWRGNHAHE